MPILSWNDIITKVCYRVGITQPTPLQRAVILNLAKDELVSIHAVAEDVKELDKSFAIFDGKEPANAPAAITTVGSTQASNGFYKYAIVYYNNLQGESKIVESNSIELVNNTIQTLRLQNIPVRPHGVDKIIIYRTKVNGNSYYKLAELTNDVTVYNDNINDSALTISYTVPEKYADTSDISLPDDLFALTKVQFYGTDNQTKLLTVETNTEEEFATLSNKISSDGGDIRKIMLGEIPYQSHTSFEDVLYQGAVVYTIRNSSNSLKINYKPRVHGYLHLTYIKNPEIDQSILTAPIDFVYSFYNLVITGVTKRYINSLLIAETNEVKLQSLTVLLRIIIDEYKVLLKSYIGYRRKKVGVQQARLPNFLNDPYMEI